MPLSDENAELKNAITKKDTADIANGASANFLGFIIRLGSRLPFLFLAVSLFGLELYGRYGFTIITIEICAAFATFGFKRSLFKFIHDGKYSDKYTLEQIMVSALTWSIIVGGIFTIFVIISAETLAKLFDYPQMVDGLKSLAPIIMVIAALDVILAGTRATRKMRYEVVARSIIEPYFLLLSMLIFYYLGFDTNGLIMAYAVALTLALIYSIWGFCRLYSIEKAINTRPDFSLIKKLISFSGPTAFHDLALLIFMRMDVFAVKFFFSEAILGIYNIAQQFATTVEKIYQSFYPILSPVMAKNLVEKDYKTVEKQMIMVSRWILMIQSALVILSIFYGEAIFAAISPENTDPALLITGGTILLFLMVGETINGGFGIADLPIIYRSPYFNPLISLSMIPIYMVLAYIFTQHYSFGPVGVAMALFSTYLLMNLIRVITIKTLFDINLFKLRIFKVIIAAALTVAAFKIMVLYIPYDLLQGWGMMIGIPSLLIIYSCSLFLIAMEKADLKKLQNKLGLKRLQIR
jgi:O-antigen/teichoic acid export membrane protein